MSEKESSIKFRSLTITLAVSFLGLCISLVFAGGGLGIYANFLTHQQLLADQQSLVAENAASLVREYIEEKELALRQVIKVGNIASEDTDKQKLMLEKLSGHVQAFRQLAVLDLQGLETIKIARVSVFYEDLLSEQRKQDLLDGLRKDDTYISQVHLDPKTNEPIILIALHITDVLGDAQGFLVAEVNLKFMWDVVSEIKVGEEGVAYVVDKQGLLIAFSDTSRVLSGEKVSSLGEVAEFVNGDERGYLSSASISKGILGKNVVANHALLNKPDWAVVVEIPASEAYRPVIRGIIVSVSTILVIIVSTIIVAIFLSRKITKPIIHLRDIASSIGQGNWDAPIDVKSNDEIGQLAEALGQMSKDLKDFKKKEEENSQVLEQEVSERTKELSRKNKELEKFNNITIGRELKMIELKKRVRDLEDQNASKS